MLLVIGVGFYFGYQKSIKMSRHPFLDQEETVKQEPIDPEKEELKQTFLKFQQLCKAKDISGIVTAFDLETIAKTNELDLQSAKKAVSQKLTQKAGQEENAPTVIEVMANAEIKSVKEYHFQKGESIPINPNEPIMVVEVKIVYGETWEVYFHKITDGWKMLNWKRIAPAN